MSEPQLTDKQKQKLDEAFSEDDIMELLNEEFQAVIDDAISDTDPALWDQSAALEYLYKLTKEAI